MANVFDEAIKALGEAIEYEKDNQEKGHSVFRELKPITPAKEYTAEDIKRIREEHNYTQSYFADLIGVSLKCVQSWEHNQSKPSASERRIIRLIEKGEDILQVAEIINV